MTSSPWLSTSKDCQFLCERKRSAALSRDATKSSCPATAAIESNTWLKPNSISVLRRGRGPLLLRSQTNWQSLLVLSSYLLQQQGLVSMYVIDTSLTPTGAYETDQHWNLLQALSGSRMDHRCQPRAGQTMGSVMEPLPRPV